MSLKLHFGPQLDVQECVERQDIGGGGGGRETGGGGKECRCHAPAASLALREDQRMR